MPAKKVKPTAKATGGQGAAATKPKGAASKVVVVDPLKEKDLQEQSGKQEQLGSQAPAVNTDLGTTAPTGNQAQPGTPAAASGAASAPAQPGAGPSSSGSSSLASIHGLAVSSSRDGFWRAGRQWNKGETVVLLAALKPHQVAQLRAEPTLTVTDVELQDCEYTEVKGNTALATEAAFSLDELDLMRQWYEMSQGSLGEEDRQLHTKICLTLPNFADRT